MCIAEDTVAFPDSSSLRLVDCGCGTLGVEADRKGAAACGAVIPRLV